MIAVIDYGMGNLLSVSKALEYVGAPVRVTSQRKEIEDADAVVLPGVGAFGRCMENLRGAGLDDTVRATVAADKPFLGICVGMQILFDESDEFGAVAGLGILPGRVRRFAATDDRKIPHMGWNEVQVRKRPPHLDGVPAEARFYFVHSYMVETQDDSIVATTTEYGETFVSSAWRGNLFATQFHPEKSQGVGLTVLRNFARQSVPSVGSVGAGQEGGS